MKQGRLFEIAETGQDRQRIHVPAHRNNPHGQEAAEHMEKSGKAGKQALAILACLAANGRMFRDQIAGKLDMLRTSVGGRLNTMQRKGWVRVTGESRGPFGRMVNVYEITEAGKERLR